MSSSLCCRSAPNRWFVDGERGFPMCMMSMMNLMKSRFVRVVVCLLSIRCCFPSAVAFLLLLDLFSICLKTHTKKIVYLLKSNIIALLILKSYLFYFKNIFNIFTILFYIV